MRIFGKRGQPPTVLEKVDAGETVSGAAASGGDKSARPLGEQTHAPTPPPDEPISAWWFFAPIPIGFIAGLALNVNFQTVKYFGWALIAYICLTVSVIKLAQLIDRRINGNLAVRRFIQVLNLFDAKAVPFLCGLGVGAATTALLA